MEIEKDVENMINNYEAARKEKSKEANEKYEKELQETRQFYKEFSHFIADTALPIFKKVKTKIHNRGYLSEIDISDMSNKEIDSRPIKEYIQIKISNINIKEEQDPMFSTLEFEANLSKKSILRRCVVPHLNENKIEYLPIASVSELTVEEELNDFLKKVFSISG